MQLHLRWGEGTAEHRAMTPADYLAVILLGLLGTGHCIGMCGAFAVAASAGSGGPGRALFRQLAYQAGKTLTYVFLAVLFATVGGWAAGTGLLPWLQNAGGVAVGLGMIALGLAYAMEFRPGPGLWRRLDGRGWCAAAGAVLRATTPLRSLLIGWINGFLPCGLSLMALVYVAGFGSVAAAAGGAALFGLATLPGLLVVALAGQQVFVRSRRGLLRLAGVALVVLGLLTLVRGVPAVHAWLHRHLMM